jgi:hypothetical protein
MERDKLSMEEAVGSTLKRAAQDTGASAADMSERATDALASAGESLRRHMPESGMMGEAAHAMSRGVRQTAHYLQGEGMSGIIEDLEVLIRRYPLQTLLVGVGSGYLLSRLRSD